MKVFAWCVVPLAAAAACAGGPTPREPAPREPAPREPAPRPMVTAQDIERSPDEPIERVLQAKYPEVQITRTGDGIAIQIRGPSSFLSDGAPLYVVDDTPMPGGRAWSLSGLNPYDIQSIRVLKNPEDIGIYGIRGANGVVLITTKRPSGSREP